MTERFRHIRSKGFTAIIACALALNGSMGCSAKKDVSNHLSAIEVGKHIEQVLELDELKKGDIDKLQKLYDISSQQVEDFVLYVARTHIKANEVAVIKVKDASEITSIEQKFIKRVETQKKKFKDYLPEEYALIENYILKTKGNYIVFAIYKNGSQIERSFDEALK